MKFWMKNNPIPLCVKRSRSCHQQYCLSVYDGLL